MTNSYICSLYNSYMSYRGDRKRSRGAIREKTMTKRIGATVSQVRL